MIGSAPLAATAQRPFTAPAACRIDELLSAAAQQYPDRIAVADHTGELTFAELDERVSRCAAGLADLVGSGSAVAVAPVLSSAYPITTYATSRCGNALVNANPFLREAALERLLTAAGVAAIFTTDAVYQVIRGLGDRVPELRAVVLVDGSEPAEDDPRVRTLAQLLDAGRNVTVAPVTVDAADTACIHFTSGTTGLPKAVGLSHRNLLACAAQAAVAHELTDDTVVLNTIPIYHPMHLNEAVYAGATQVLCADRDPAVAIETANQRRADCFFALPAQLAQLAADPRLPRLRLDTARVIRAGGTELKPAVATALSKHFAIPVIQGYGMAETSSLTHCDVRENPKIGSVGPVVRGTECRVIGLTDGEPVATGERGEVQVRGPQVMAGYLDAHDDSGIDADGWLATGDIGYLDSEGYLFLVDRLKDVFKCDNEMVSPTEIENVLVAHPAVRQCVVVDYPDQIHGSVAHALVVPQHPDEPLPDQEILDFVNRQVAYYQRIHHLDSIDEIPGAAFGKIQRRLIRDRIRTAGTTVERTLP